MHCRMCTGLIEGRSLLLYLPKVRVADSEALDFKTIMIISQISIPPHPKTDFTEDTSNDKDSSI